MPTDPPRDDHEFDPAAAPERRRLGAVTLRELTAGLLWPEMFRALGMSIQGPRLLLGIVGAIVLTAVVMLAEALRRATDWAALNALAGLLDWMPTPMRAEATDAADALGGWSALIAALIVGVIFATVGGAIARLAALDVALHRDVPIREGVRYVRRRLATFALTIVIPCVVLAVPLALATPFGWLMRIEAIQPVIAVLSIVPIVLVLAFVMLGAAFVVVLPLLPAAIAIEDTDATDAVQRGLAYLFSAFWRYLAYGALLVLQALVALAIGRFLIDTALVLLSDLLLTPMDIESAAFEIVRWLGMLPELVLMGWLFSFVATGGAIHYLAMRQTVDAEDLREIAHDPAESPPAAAREGDAEAIAANGADSAAGESPTEQREQ